MKQLFKQIASTAIGSALLAGFSATVIATPVIVTDISNWGTTPMEIVDLNLPYAGYNGGVYAGINTLSVTEGANTFTASGFCIDPFHFSLDGPKAYNTVALGSAPKYPGPMGATTALEIEELWHEYFPTAQTSSTVAAGLQLAIWELVVDAAAAANHVPTSTYYTLTSGNDYGAAADIASLVGYSGPAADLIGLTGPGQDYVIENPTPAPPPNVPDGGTTLILLGVAMGGLQGLRRKIG
jgi:hypothetical protein